MLSRFLPKSRLMMRNVCSFQFIKEKNLSMEENLRMLKEQKKEIKAGEIIKSRQEVEDDELQFRELLYDFENKLEKKEKLTSKLNRYKPTPGPPQHHVSLQNNFLHGFEKQDFEGFNPVFKKAFALQNATEGQIIKFKKSMALKKYQREITDTGSPAVRVAMISERMLHIVRHIKNNKNDKICFKYLIIFLNNLISVNSFGNC